MANDTAWEEEGKRSTLKMGGVRKETIKRRLCRLKSRLKAGISRLG